MNKKLLSGLCAGIMLVGLVGCGPKEPKQDTTTSTSTAETKETETTAPKKDTTNKKSEYGNKSEDYYVFHQDKYETFHLRGMGRGPGSKVTRMETGDFDISVKIPENYYVDGISVLSDQENKIKEVVRWNNAMKKIESNSTLGEDRRMSLEDIESNEHLWMITSGMRKEKTAFDLEDVFQVSLAYSTNGNYEELDMKDNPYLAPGRNEVSTVDYKGYTLKVFTGKEEDGSPSVINSYLYLGNDMCLWTKYIPEDTMIKNMKNLSQDEVVKLATKLLDEFVTINKK